MQKIEVSVVTWPCTTFIINKQNCWLVCQTSIKRMQNWHSGTLPISKTCSWICLGQNFTSNCYGETMEFKIIQVILKNNMPNFPKIVGFGQYMPLAAVMMPLNAFHLSSHRHCLSKKVNKRYAYMYIIHMYII